MEKKPLEKMPNDQFQKLFIPLPWMAFENSEGKGWGQSLNWKHKGIAGVCFIKLKAFSRRKPFFTVGQNYFY